jgi:hypothetical protein
MEDICTKKYGKNPDRYATEIADCPKPESFCKLCCEGAIGIEFL